jgi:hypothetical protein
MPFIPFFTSHGPFLFPRPFDARERRLRAIPPTNIHHPHHARECLDRTNESSSPIYPICLYLRRSVSARFEEGALFWLREKLGKFGYSMFEEGDGKGRRRVKLAYTMLRDADYCVAKI